MLVPWMLYAVIVTAAVGVAALLAEGALRALGRPTRWAWMGALVAAVAVPVFVTWLTPEAAADAAPVASSVIPLEGLTAVGVASVAGGLELTWILGVAWAVASGALLLLFAHGWIRLAAWKSEWELRVVDGRTVLLSRGTGPAVVGIWPGRIVLPRWILDLDSSRRRMILDHEAEHLRAGDPLFLLLAGLPVAAFPWNPALWWMRSRLRAAVEIDCDERVMEQVGRDRRGYGELLLDVGGKSRVPAGVFPGFAERPSLLERRLLALTRGLPERPLRQAGYLLAGAAGLIFVACGIPTPDALMGPEVTAAETSADGADQIPIAPTTFEESPVVDLPPTPDELAEGRAEEAIDEGPEPPLEAGPSFTPFTIQPELENPREVQTALEEAYPPLLRDAGIGGTAVVWFFIDASGQVQETRIAQSSGHETLDEAALHVAESMDFSPAMNRDERVPVWVQFPITFQVR